MTTTAILPTATTLAVAPPVVIDFGDILNQLIGVLEPVAAGAAQAGVTLAAGEVPGGALILDFLGTQMVSQFVAQGAAAMEGWLKGQVLTISPHNALESLVANAINSELPAVSSFFGAKLAPMISAAVAKVLPAPAPAAATAASNNEPPPRGR